MEKLGRWKPEWMEKEPKAPVSAYSYYQSKMRIENAETFEEMTFGDQNKELAKSWRELTDEKKNKVIRSFEKAKEKHGATHNEWLSGLNEYQRQLYERLQAAKNAFGAKPLVDSANMARELLAKMDAVPENEQFDIFTLNEDDCRRIRDMYLESVGIKIKKLSTRKTKWDHIIAGQKNQRDQKLPERIIQAKKGIDKSGQR